MRYYKDIQGDYIVAIGTGGGGTEITESEYNTIMSVIQNKPQRTETMDYHLRTDLTWEQFTVITPEEDLDYTPQMRKDSVAPVEISNTATRNYVINDLLFVENTLYKVTENIANGGEIIEGKNVQRTSLSEELSALNN